MNKLLRRDLLAASPLLKFQWNMSTRYIQPLATADLVFSAQLRQTDLYYQNLGLPRVIMTPTHLSAAAR